MSELEESHNVSSEKVVISRIDEPRRKVNTDVGLSPTSSEKNKRRSYLKSPVVMVKTVKKNLSYAEILKKAKEEIKLEECGIESTRIREAFTGGLVIQVLGEDGKKGANLLAGRLRTVLGQDVKIACTVRMREFVLIGLDGFSTIEDVRSRGAEEGGCPTTEVHVGTFGRLPNGGRTSLVRCPEEAANRLVSHGDMIIGWARVRIDASKTRSTQCYKCWRFGHVRQACRSNVDRTGRCYRCGGTGHQAKCCSIRPRCVICEEDGYYSNHRIGSPRCRNLSRSSANGPPIGRPRKKG